MTVADAVGDLLFVLAAGAVLIIILLIVTALSIGLIVKGVTGGAASPADTPAESPAESPAASSRYAYCTLVMKGDGYVPGALVLGESLRQNCPGPDRVCMVTDDVSPAAREALATVWTHVRQVPYINYKSRTASRRHEELYSHWISSAYTKWNLLDFTEYSRILFMDADTTATEDLAPLFEMHAPAICMGNPWMRPLSPNGLDNPIGPKHHGDLIPADQVRTQLAARSSGFMGGVVLLQPAHGSTDRLRRMLSRYPVFPPPANRSFAGADEQAIAMLMIETGHTWAALGNRYNYMLGKTAMLEGEQPPSPAVRHYYHNKPWDYGRDHWEEYLPWYALVDSLTARHPELRQYFPKA